MPAVIEKLGLEGDVSLDGPTIEVPYLVRDAVTYDEASTAFATSPDLDTFVTIGGQTLPYQGFHFTELGGGKWEFRARYNRHEVTSGEQAGGPDEGGGQNQPAFTFDTTGGGTQHITQAIATKAVYAGPTETDNPPEFQGAIGAGPDGVEGCDVETPGYSFSYTHHLPIALWTPAYRTKLRNLTQKVNDAPWVSPSGDSFERGEVRFRGVQGSRRGWDDVELTFHFVGEENLTDETVGPITGINKEGQDYIWFWYESATSGNFPIKRPRFAVVAQVYKYGNFADLAP